MLRTNLSMLVLAAVACLTVTVRGQASATPGTVPGEQADSPVQQAGTGDLGQLLAKAAVVNGLDGPNVKPWHLKASFETFDDDGKSKSTGTFEEWWAGEGKHKSTFIVGGVSQTDYAADKGILRTGSQDWFERAVMRVPGDMTKPIAARLENYEFEEEDKTLGPVKVRCVTLRPLKTEVVPPGMAPFMYCLDAEKPTLRVRASLELGGAYQSYYNHLVEFQDEYLAKDLEVMHDHKPVVKIHLESVESLATIEDGEFTPPADAVRPAPRMVNISGAVAASSLLQKVAPDYPEAAKEMRLEGVVVIQATIAKDGHVRDLKVVSGPRGLQQAALDAVEQWVYKPYLLNGKPVEVMTTVNVVFSLHR
jgi:TonB family protein